ncbi:hypothetical protein Dimus_007738, partial [Dionaea muscipula]
MNLELFFTPEVSMLNKVARMIVIASNGKPQKIEVAFGKTLLVFPSFSVGIIICHSIA